MKISKFIPVIALAMGLSTLSFAGNPKGEAKAAPTETKTETKTGTLYFFPISDDGGSYTSTTVPDTQNDFLCDGQSDKYCSVGLTIDQVILSGGNATVNLTVVPTPPMANRDFKQP